MDERERMIMLRALRDELQDRADRYQLEARPGTQRLELPIPAPRVTIDVAKVAESVDRLAAKEMPVTDVAPLAEALANGFADLTKAITALVDTVKAQTEVIANQKLTTTVQPPDLSAIAGAVKDALAQAATMQTQLIRELRKPRKRKLIKDKNGEPIGMEEVDG